MTDSPPAPDDVLSLGRVVDRALHRRGRRRAGWRIDHRRPLRRPPGLGHRGALRRGRLRPGVELDAGEIVVIAGGRDGFDPRD